MRLGEKLIDRKRKEVRGEKREIISLKCWIKDREGKKGMRKLWFWR